MRAILFIDVGVAAVVGGLTAFCTGVTTSGTTFRAEFADVNECIVISLCTEAGIYGAGDGCCGKIVISVSGTCVDQHC